MVKQDRVPDHHQDGLVQAFRWLRSENEEDQLRGFDVVFELYEAQVTRFVLRSLRSHANRYPARYSVLHDLAFHADNASQETWVVIYRKIGVFDCEDETELANKLRNWISSIAAHVVSEYVRGIQRWAEQHDPLDDDQEDTLPVDELLLGSGSPHGLEDDLQYQERVATLLAAIRRLPPVEQEVVIQRILYERSYDEIAEMLGRSNEALRVLYSRKIKPALRRLMMELSTDEMD